MSFKDQAKRKPEYPTENNSPSCCQTELKGLRTPHSGQSTAVTGRPQPSLPSCPVPGNIASASSSRALSLSQEMKVATPRPCRERPCFPAKREGRAGVTLRPPSSLSHVALVPGEAAVAGRWAAGPLAVVSRIEPWPPHQPGGHSPQDICTGQRSPFLIPVD